MKYFIFNMELLNNNGLVFQFSFKCIKNSILCCSRINNVIITIIYLCMYVFIYPGKSLFEIKISFQVKPGQEVGEAVTHNNIPRNQYNWHSV